MIAALFVEKGGCYYRLPGVDPWDTERDARKYQGPYPVVAHPPCARWGRYWGGGPILHNTRYQKTLGDDQRCFAHAIEAVIKFGGVLEHPEASHAWRVFGINRPPRKGGWVEAGFKNAYTCCVEQGAYGHPARKATWLFVYGVDFGNLPDLNWRAEGIFKRIDEGFHNKKERKRKTGTLELLTKKQRLATPVKFRDVLLDIARKTQINKFGEYEN